MYRKYIEPVVKVVAETARLAFCFQYAVGGRNHPHVCFNGSAAYSFDFFFLQYSQQLRLLLQWQLPYFIEEDSALMRLFKFTGAALQRACKSAFLMAKQFGFDQLGRQCGTVNLHHRTCPAGRPFVDSLCYDFFAGTRFPGKQYRGVGIRHLPHLLYDRL